MYELADVFEYGEYKIWIKKIIDKIYFVNNCIIACSIFETLSIERIANLLDSCFTPFLSHFDDMCDFVVYTELDDGDYVMTPYSIADNKDVIDVDKIGKIREEYNMWASSLSNKNTVYRNDLRDMDMGEYLKKYGVKKK